MVFWVIMGVAIGNLLLGFALAVFLNRRYQTLQLMSSQTGSSSETFWLPQTDLDKKGVPDRRQEADSVSEAVTVPVLLSPEGEPVVSEPELEEPSPMGLEEEAGEVSDVASEMEDTFGSPRQESESVSSEDEVPEVAEGEVPAESSPPPETLAESTSSGEPSERESLEEIDGNGGRRADPIDTSPTSSDLDRVPSETGNAAPPKSQRSEDASNPQPEEDSSDSRAVVEPEEDARTAVTTRTSDSDTAQRSYFSTPSTSDPESKDRATSKGGREGPSGLGEKRPEKDSSESEGARGETAADSELSVSPGVGQAVRHSEEKDKTDAPAPTQSSPSPNGLEASLERALEQWQKEAARYFQQLSQTRTKVQNLSEHPETKEIHASLGEIHRAGQEYLATARPARDAFGQLTNLRPAMAPMQDHLNTLAAKEEALIELTQDLVPQVSEESESHLLRQQLLQHTDRLLAANQKIQAVLEDAVHGPPKPISPAEADASRRSGNGAILDESVREKVFTWWEQRQSRLHRLSIVLLGIDDFEQLEEKYGTLLCEGLLRAMEKLLDTECGSEDILVPLSGSRFACFCADHSLDKAVDRAEYLRQTLIATRFYRRRTELRISVSCGVAEATREDTPETILERAEVALLQARRYGKGRTFSHDGYFPMPVPPHPLHISPKEFEI